MIKKKGEITPRVYVGFTEDAPLRKATIRWLARQALHENEPRIKLGLLQPAGKLSFLRLSLTKLHKSLFSTIKSSVPHCSGFLAIVFTAVFLLGSAAFGAFGARRSDGWGDAVEAGRHPPAGGWTPETDTQRAIAANKLPLRRLHTGCPRNSPPNYQRKRRTAFRVWVK